MLRTTLALILPLLAVGTAQAQTSPPTHSEFWREAKISIAPDGKVSSVQFLNTNAKKDVLGERLEPVIRGWVFEPGKVDGKPMATETTLHLHLDMRKTGADAVAVSLLDASTGVGQAKMTAPEYPHAELEQGIEAKFNMRLAIDDAGVITDMKVEKSVSNGAKSDADRFEKAIRSAAKSWRFQPEVVGGHAMASTARIPVSFCVGSGNCNTLKLDPVNPGTETPNGVAMTLDSRAKLVTQVAGTKL